MKTVAFSIVGTVLDKRGKGKNRWNKWRPTISICQHEDLLIDRLELLCQPSTQGLADQVAEDIKLISPETEVRFHHLDFQNPWDFETVYSALFDFSQNYKFRPEVENYLVHITTGTHVAQICLYLLNETHYFPGKLLQTSPLSAQSKRTASSLGKYQIIDLDLSKYDQIASRFKQQHVQGTTYLKGGIETENIAFNKMIEQLEKVSIRSREPILLSGPTGAGKSKLAERIFQLKKQRGQLTGEFVVVNCATLKGDNAMSALFGHTKGAFTGANNNRSGLLKQADKGMLFLDEIAELGVDEQAMLLRAIEEKRFLPLGSDQESGSNFQLIAGTNKNLPDNVNNGLFREDLLARINLWSYQLPSLKQRMEDFIPNLKFELNRYAKQAGHLVSFNQAAKQHYLEFAYSNQAIWSANFRDLNSSITRMATLSDGGRISVMIVKDEIIRLLENWHSLKNCKYNPSLETEKVLGKTATHALDLYDHILIAGLIEVCQNSTSMADAGRKLFACSRNIKKSRNDSHRIKVLLNKYGLEFEQLKKGKRLTI